MKKEDILKYIRKDGYDINFTNGTKTIYNFSKYFDKNHKNLKLISDAYLSIGLEVKFKENEKTEFEFIFVTTIPTFKFSSGVFSDVLRQDFDELESSFELYCSFLQKCYNLYY